MAKRRNDQDYFARFEDLGKSCALIAKEVQTFILDYNPIDLPKKLEDFHAIEHAADKKQHELIEFLIKDFITPIEREDIIALASSLDDITDSIEDVPIKLYTMHIYDITPEAREFMEIIVKSCAKLVEILKVFRYYKKTGAEIRKSIIEVSSFEEQADRLHINAVRRLFEECKNPMEATAWLEIYAKLEKCCDALDRTAAQVGEVIMKNS